MKKEIEKLKIELEKCEKEKKEYLEGWQRERADFLNYKKEELERFSEIINFANEELILKILPVLDNFEKAEKEIPEDLKNNEYLKGIFQIKKQLEEILKNLGVERIECLNKKFDPKLHEAVEEIKVDGKESQIVVEEVLAGYKLKGKLIRPAKVKISK